MYLLYLLYLLYLYLLYLYQLYLLCNLKTPPAVLPSLAELPRLLYKSAAAPSLAPNSPAAFLLLDTCPNKDKNSADRGLDASLPMWTAITKGWTEITKPLSSFLHNNKMSQ
jgi:hypothetical protein